MARPSRATEGKATRRRTPRPYVAPAVDSADLEHGRAVIAFPPPPSVNATRGETWHATLRRRRVEVATVGRLLLSAGVPRPIPGDRVHVTAHITFPSSRRRDEGNYRAPLEKAVGDALAPADAESLFRWLTDDTPDHFTFGTVTFGIVAHTPALAHVAFEWNPRG